VLAHYYGKLGDVKLERDALFRRCRALMKDVAWASKQDVVKAVCLTSLVLMNGVLMASHSGGITSRAVMNDVYALVSTVIEHVNKATEERKLADGPPAQFNDVIKKWATLRGVVDGVMA
jgi:hypothetical protein